MQHSDPAPGVPPDGVLPSALSSERPTAAQSEEDFSLRSYRHAFDVLANKQFRLLWFSMLLGYGAMQASVILRSWLAYDISGSALALGIVALARGVPMATLTLVGGAWADRMDKRLILAVVHVGMGALAAVNGLLVHLDLIQLWHLIIFGVIQGTIFAFAMPARQAMIPEVVSKAQLPNALALNASGMNLNHVIAPAFAGLLIAWNPAVAFDIVAVVWVLGALLLLRLPAMRAAKRSSSTIADVRDGLRYVWQRPDLLILLAMVYVVAMLAMPFQQLLPIFQKDVLEKGPSALGLMHTAVGIGGLVGSLVVAALAQSPHKQVAQVFAGVAFGLLLMAFALSTTFPLSLALLVCVGLMSQSYLTLNNVLVMTQTEPGYYGRVMGINMLAFAMIPIAMLPFGAIVDQVGVSQAVATSGMLVAVVLLLITAGRRYVARRVVGPASTPVQ